MYHINAGKIMSDSARFPRIMCVMQQASKIDAFDSI